MRALPTLSLRLRRTALAPPAAAALVALLAVAALGAVACGNDLPPGARPIGDTAGAAGSGPAAAPQPATPAGQVPTVPTPTPGPNAPRVVALDPPEGAQGVDPSRTTLSVTFDRPMGREGWAWVVESAATAPEIGDARFDASGRTNTVDVKLEPNRSYVLWINSQTYTYFKGLDGTPAVPYRWTFSTGPGTGAGGDAGAPARGTPAPPEVPLVSTRPSAAPRVVAFDPANGATGVDPHRQTIAVTFDRPMEESWAWVTEPGTIPPPTAGEPSFTADQQTNVLPVHLAPSTTYTIWINSEQHLLFRSLDDQPAVPVRWTFTTGPE